MKTDLSIQLTSASLISTLSEIGENKLLNQGILHQFIQKKTKRGRKSKHELPKNEKCQLCLEFIQYSQGELTKCSVCKVRFHSSCYKHSIPNKDSFKCERCTKANKENKVIGSYKCFICYRGDGVLYEQGYTGEFYHQICLRFLPELCEDLHDECITKTNIRRWRYKNSCKYCKEKLCDSKAVIKCSNPKCKCFFHIPCAIQKETIFSIKYSEEYFNIKDNKVSLPFFCCAHNKRLVAAYRNEIIEQNNINSNKEFLSAKTELSAKDTTEVESDDNDNDNENEYVYVYNKMIDMNNENEELYSIQGSKALNLNFDELIEESESQLVENNCLDINDIFPNNNFFFDVNFDNNTTEDCSLPNFFNYDTSI